MTVSAEPAPKPGDQAGADRNRNGLCRGGEHGQVQRRADQRHQRPGAPDAADRSGDVQQCQ